MDSRKILGEQRLLHWARIVRQCNESGLTKREFLKNNGIRENIFYYWQKRVREAVCEQLLLFKKDNQTNSMCLSTEKSSIQTTEVIVQQNFTEVMLPDNAPDANLVPRDSYEISDPSCAEVPASVPTSSLGQIQIEVEGLTITADSSYPTTSLAELLKGLMSHD